MLPGDRLGDTEDHRTSQLEQQHHAGGSIQQLLLLLVELHIVIGGADGLHLSRLKRAHPINGEHVGHEHTDSHGRDQIHQHGESDHAVGDHRCFHRQVMSPLEKIPVDDVDTHLHSDTSKHRQGDA